MCWGLIILPIPIGFIWLWIYQNRHDFGFPDWFSGILAQGIISGHKISEGTADDDDYFFIVIATVVVSFLIVLCLFTLFNL